MESLSFAGIAAPAAASGHARLQPLWPPQPQVDLAEPQPRQRSSPSRLLRPLAATALLPALSVAWSGQGRRRGTSKGFFVGVGAGGARYIARQMKLSNASLRAADESADAGEMESTDMSFLQKLINKQREATEIGICTEDWHSELFDDVPEGYREALEAGVELVDVLANSSALKLLASAPPKGQPRYSVRVSPKPTLGLGYIVHRSVVQHYSVLSPLQQTMKRLSVGEIETLTIHSLGQGRMHFPFWVYDAVVEAYQKGLCSRIGVSHPNADVKSVLQAKQELERRGASLSCVFVKLSLLQREAVQFVKDCRKEGLQVFATEVLGPDELASGRYTAANPTGGEISVPRFTLAQLMPLRPLHDALEEVARGLRARVEKPNIDTTQVALQWVVSKGASPLCDVTTSNNAKAIAGCKGPDGQWKLTPEEEARLDEAAEEVAKTRRRW